jgi:hypothetical protein
MGIMDFLSSSSVEAFGTGFLEEKIKQQKAFAKSMADRAKLKDEMLAEIATDKAKNINEINAELEKDEIIRQREEDNLLAMYSDMNPEVLAYLKDQNYFYNNDTWNSFSDGFETQAGGSQKWYKMKPIGATDTWENIMAEQIKNSYKDKDTKDGTADAVGLQGNTKDFMLDVAGQPFSLLDPRVLNPVAFQEFQTSALNLKKLTSEVTIAEWDAQNKSTIGNLNIELQNQQKDLNDLSIKLKNYDLQTQPKKDFVELNIKNADLLTKQITNETLKEKNNLILDELKLSISKTEQTMSFAEASQDLNLQKLKAQVNNLTLEGQLKEIMVQTEPEIRAERLHGMQLANIEQSIRNETFGEHEQEILNNIKLRNETLRKNIDTFDEETKNNFREQELRIQKLEKDLEQVDTPTLISQGAVRKEVNAPLSLAVGARKISNTALGTVEFSLDEIKSPWITDTVRATEDKAIAQVQKYQAMISTPGTDFTGIDPKRIDINNISNRIMGNELNLKYIEDLNYIKELVRTDVDNFNTLPQQNKKIINGAINQIMRGLNVENNKGILKQAGVKDETINKFFRTKDGPQGTTTYNDSMINTIMRFRKNEFSEDKDIQLIQQ